MAMRAPPTSSITPANQGSSGKATCMGGESGLANQPSSFCPPWQRNRNPATIRRAVSAQSLHLLRPPSIVVPPLVVGSAPHAHRGDESFHVVQVADQRPPADLG